MRNRRNILIAFLLCATLIVGIGYASVADVLDVDGTAEYGITGDFDGNIKFVSAYAYDNITDSASVTSTNNDKVTFTAKSVTDAEGVAHFRFEIVNSNATEAIIYLSNFTMSETATDKTSGQATTTEGNRIYKLGYMFCSEEPHADEDAIHAHKADFIPATEGVNSYVQGAETNFTLGAGETAYLYIAVALNDTRDNFPPNSTVSATFGLEFSAWSEAASSNT